MSFVKKSTIKNWNKSHVQNCAVQIMNFVIVLILGHNLVISLIQKQIITI